MPTAAALRLEIEHALERKFPAALTPAPRRPYEVAATGIRCRRLTVAWRAAGGGDQRADGSWLLRAGRAWRSGLWRSGRRRCGHARGWTCQDAFDPGVGRGEWGATDSGCCGCAAGMRPAGPRRDAATRTTDHARICEQATGADLVDEARSGAAGDGSAAAGRVDLRPSCWTWAIRRRSRRAAFRWPRGSATGRRRSARSAAWWCWAGGPMRSRLRRWCWSARRRMR